MIKTDYWALSNPRAPLAISYGPKASCERWRDRNHPYPAETYVMAEVPSCVCCGSFEVKDEWADGWRCARHWQSVPCQVDGCKRTAPRDKYSETICAAHWRAGVPPGSPARQVWNRFRRVVKRFGWSPERAARSDRLWAWLKARCQAAARGDLDQREIDKLFGWDA